jgi:signal recognition particle subunit SRP54
MHTAQRNQVEVGVTPSQQLVKLVNDTLTAALGGDAAPLARAERGPTIILLAGLQGAGKTTAAAKLAALLRRQGRTPMLVATDTFRPAAIEQLVKMGALVGVPVFEQGTRPKPADIARAGVEAAIAARCDTVIIDTAGRVAVRLNLSECKRHAVNLTPRALTFRLTRRSWRNCAP